MCECLQLLSEPTRLWFTQSFGEPTEAQQLAWPLIHARNNVLVIAPTGSGKTLSAFLAAIDDIIEKKREEQATQSSRRRHRNRGVRVLYISPLKALGVDVAKNLEIPLQGIRSQYEQLGIDIPEISIAIRSGDTPTQERRKIVSNPPDILVTTPESLYLMLTSKARTILDTVSTVILDEVHAVAGTKRGVHLALSLERLDSRLQQPAQRIGLSATVNPVEQVAHFLGGKQPVVLAQASGRPALDLKVIEPVQNMVDRSSSQMHVTTRQSEEQHISGVTPAMRRVGERKQQNYGEQSQHSNADPSTSVWPYIQESVLDEILAHQTTLVFVNSRGLAERFTAQLNDLYAQRQGKEKPTHQEPAHYRSSFGSTSKLVGSTALQDTIAMAHHGSVSKDRRKYIEEQLKQGKLKCVVATSSLELGIDMGSVDLVIQIAPPMSVASGLQRVGRADHRVGGVSHAQMYPITREQIIGAAVSAELMLAGSIEPIHIPQSPLDVLAQQTVAAASLEPISVDEWFTTVRRAAPYTNLPRDVFDAVIGMVTGAYNSEEFSAFRPPLTLEEDSGLLAARPGAQRLATTSGGTIPDRGLYTVVLPESEAGSGLRRVGELDEEMVYESRVGDVITLGTTSWQIQEITHDRVVVLPAPGRSARLPFWHGEGDGRDYRFAVAQGQWLAQVARGCIGANETHEGAVDSGQPRFTAATRTRLIADGLDENAINNLAAFICEQRASTGVVPDAEHIVIERCPTEEGDWRVIVHAPFGKRVHEPWALAINARLLQRYGIDGQVYAADTGIVLRLPEGDGRVDIAQLLAIDPDDIQRIVETQVSNSVLFAARFRECAARALFMPRLHPGKRVPLWQQRLRAAQLLTAARAHKNFPLLLETARECLQDVYDVPALHEVLTNMHEGTITTVDVETSTPSPMADTLLFGFVGSVMYQYNIPQAERNAQLLSMDPQVLERLIGVDDVSSVLDNDIIDAIKDQLASHTFWNDLSDDDIAGRVHRYAVTHTPFTADTMIQDLGSNAEISIAVLHELESAGQMITGRFDDRLPADIPQWVHVDVLKKIRTRSLAKARQAIQPVDMCTYQSFVIERQGIGSCGGERYEGPEGVLRVIEQLEGIALPIRVWEEAIFPVRVHNYQPNMLDELVSNGEVVWVAQGTTDGKERVPLLSFFLYDSVLFQHHCQTIAMQYAVHEQDNDTVSIEQAIMQVLQDGGAYNIDQLEQRARSIWDTHPETMIDTNTGEIVPSSWSNSDFVHALWRVVEQGYITNSTLSVVRSVPSSHTTHRVQHSLRRKHVAMQRPHFHNGLWSFVHSSVEPISSEEYGMDVVHLLLDRYGVIASPIVQQAGIAGGFSGIYPILRRMEEQGLLVRGMFVQEFGAIQFAQRETVDLLRAQSDKPSATLILEALDPANLYGAATSWPPFPNHLEEQETAGIKFFRRAEIYVAMHGGEVILYFALRSGRLIVFSEIETLITQACKALADMLRRQLGKSITIKECNGCALRAQLPIAQSLRAAGFVPSPQGMKLYR